MTKKIDARKLQCPAPVLKTKEYLEQEAPSEIDVMVDNEAAAENVSRFLDFQGFEVSVDSDNITITVSGRRDPEQAKQQGPGLEPVQTDNPGEGQKILVVLSSQQLGKG